MNVMNALAGGYTAKQILAFIKRSFPNMASRIDAAEAAGYPIQKILELIGQVTPQKLKKLNPIPEDSKYRIQGENPYIQGQQAQQQGPVAPEISAIGGTIAPLALGVAGSLAASRALPSIVQKLAPGLVEPTASTAIGAVQAQPQAPQQAPIVPSAIEVPKVNSADILSKMGFLDRVKNLVKAGNMPEGVIATLQSIITPGQKKFLKEQGIELEDVVNDFVSTQPQEEKQNPAEKMARTAILPDGKIGEIQDIKNGVATINVDGQQKRRRESDIEEVPISAKELADTYENVLRGVEKFTGEEVSRFIDWAGYDEERKKLSFRAHNSDETFEFDVLPEDIEKLKSLHFRKTTGGNNIGAFIAGTKSPMGSAIYKLIEEIKSRVPEGSTPHVGKYKTLYEGIGEAKKVHKEEKKKEAKAISEKKKMEKAKLKEELKKRKNEEKRRKKAKG